MARPCRLQYLCFLGLLLIGLAIVDLYGRTFLFADLNSPKMSTTNDAGSTVATSWQASIDLAILWSGPPTPHIPGTEVVRERFNNELPYELRSVAKNAPWIRKIWILVNTEVTLNHTAEELSNLVPESLKNRTTFVDRCSYMPKGTCPTRNSHAVKTFAHRIPGLAEHFILIDDDIFLGRPVTPSHFYENGKPFVWRETPTWGFFAGKKFHRVYKDPSVASFPLPKSAAPCPHFWNPQLKSTCAAMERQYPEFYAFVGSHVAGRYSSLAKGPSDDHNSQEECMIGFINWEYLRTGQGIFKNIDGKRFKWWDEAEISENGFQKIIRDKPIFMNVNDRFSKNETVYQKQIGWYRAAMETFLS